MSLPLSDRYLIVWSESFARNLPSEQAGLDDAGARKAVQAAMAQAWQEVEDYASAALLNESRAAAREVDRKKRDEARAERQRKEIEVESAKVWRSHFGRHIAGQLEGHAFVTFALVSCLDLQLAVEHDRVIEFIAAVKANGGAALHVEDTGRRVVGYRIATQADRLDAADFDKAVEAVDRERERFALERDERAKAKAKQVAAAREQGEQRRMYGAPVPSGGDDE